MICIECRQQADMNKGCSKPCSQGCDCQHRAKKGVKDEPTADPTDC